MAPTDESKSPDVDHPATMVQQESIANHEPTSNSSSPKQGARSSSAHPPSTMTDASVNSRLPDGNAQNDQQTETASAGNPDDVIAEFDWDELEARFHRKMEGCEKIEQAIFEEFHDWLRVRYKLEGPYHDSWY